MIRLPESPAATQAVAWVGHLDDGSRLLVRLYTDGSATAERRVAGAYMGEACVDPRAGDVVSSTHREYVDDGYSVCVQHCEAEGCDAYLGVNYPAEFCVVHKVQS